MMFRPFRNLGDERGMALPMVIGVMMLVGALSAALLTTVQADTGLSRRDQDRKAAYAAAEAGLNNYLFRLADDSEIWSHCTLISGTPFVSNPYSGTGLDGRRWRNVPGSEAQYTVELLPKPGQTQCNPASSATAAATIFDQGILRIRATGRMRGQKRSIVAHLRRKQFLDYIYFTNYETADPVWYLRYSHGKATTGTPATAGGPAADIVTWANANCRYYRDARDAAGNKYTGTYAGGTITNRPCDEINFANTDQIIGPFHTNDSVLACGAPTFGGGAGTPIEFNPPDPGWRPNTNCSGGPPVFNGTVVTRANILTLPPTNAALINDVLPGYIFTGGQHITLLSNGTFDIKSSATGSPTVNLPYPANGLIYVQNGACGSGYRAYDPYYNNVAGGLPGCADVFVHGSYNASLTIASQKDVVIDGNISKSGDYLLGLIANEFVRVEHRATAVDVNNDCDNLSPVHNNISIDAAIMSLAHSFTVDNYFCGATMGTLTVNGAITQNYRGAVGTIGNSGYIKNYVYDPRLAYRSPPHFLDPVSAGWRLLTDNEQIPAT